MCRKTLQQIVNDDCYSAEHRMFIAAALDLIESVELDTSTDGGESYSVLGNVNTETLRTLGFDIPNCEPRTAFTAVVVEGGFIIGEAEENQPGYWPRTQYGNWPTYDEARAKAHELNAAKGLDEATAAMIVASSMRKQNERSHA